MTDQPAGENVFGASGALALEFHEDRLGKNWISCDSVYDLFASLAGDATGPLADGMAKLANSFRPFTTYAQLDGTAPAGEDAQYESIKPYECPGCGLVVVSAPMYRDRDTVVVADFLPHPDGTLVPMCSATDPDPQLHFLDRATVEEAGERPPCLRVHKCGQP